MQQRRIHKAAGVAALALGGLWAAGAWAEQVAVVVQETSIRADRQFYAPTLATAGRNDRLEVLERQGAWIKVRSGATTGWVQRSAVGDAAAGRPGAGQGDGAASAAFGGIGQALSALSAPLSGQATAPASGYSEDEVALAGKGFSPEVEAQYRGLHPEADFRAVDRLEALTASPTAIAAFAQAGRLEPPPADLVAQHGGASQGGPGFFDRAGGLFKGKAGDHARQDNPGVFEP